MTGEQQLARAHQLMAWFRSHGVCWSCSIDFSVVQVDKECGGHGDPVYVGCIRQAPRTGKYNDATGLRETCRTTARRVYAQLPPPAQEIANATTG